MGFSTYAVGFIALLVGIVYVNFPGDLLSGISSDTVLTGWQLQLAVTGFCLSSVPDKFLEDEYGRDIGGDFTFVEDGDMENEDYTKASIYSLLYALYANVGTIKSDLGVP